MNFETVFSFALTSLLIELTPGPNMAYLAIISLSRGRRAGLFSLVGVALGLLIVGGVSALGLATLIQNSPLAYHMLRWGGVLYLLWLAWSGWHEEDDLSDMSAVSVHHADVRFFARGLVTNLLNPKAAVFYIAILPGFFTMSTPIISQGLILTGLYVAIASAIHGGIVVLADGVRRFIEDERSVARLRKILSVLLALVAVWFAYSTGLKQ